jgi:hypothetical protein
VRQFDDPEIRISIPAAAHLAVGHTIHTSEHRLD